MFDKKLLATLRLHCSSITNIETFYIPSSLTFKLDDSGAEQFPLFNPSLITADESGVLIWWNMATRRPLGIWKAHDDAILTVKQLGLRWKSVSTCDANAPETNQSFGQLLTHSKDGTIKIWKLIDILNFESLEFTYTGLLKKKLADDISSVMPPLLFEMPVNNLNFSNIDINFSGLQITPATTESEGFDIYSVDLTQSEEHQKLRRLVQNYKLRTENEVKNQDVGVAENADLTKREGTGVIMKIAWLDKDQFAIGYESGKLVIFRLFSKCGEFRAEEILIDDSLVGNPITSITFDKVHNKLLWASTGSKVCILNLNELTPNIFELKHKGVSDIAVDTSTNSVGIITWDGYVRFYDYCENDILKFVSKTRRRVPAISTSKEAVEFNNDTTQNNAVDMQRASVVKFTIKQVDPSQNKLGQIVYTNGRCKNLVKRNRENIYGERWMFVGYHDGNVSINLII